MTKILKRLRDDEQGASMTEYALLLAMIALGTVGAVTAFSDQILTLFSSFDQF
ncbi:MAG: Flp family type IVb pilin [Deltaproteobacteria bacterium]|jgi:Flp pilus assembly pilin Flp|nr:Flp family type IVb pilin [Deltaproteobacteria bacterium]